MFSKYLVEFVEFQDNHQNGYLVVTKWSNLYLKRPCYSADDGVNPPWNYLVWGAFIFKKGDIADNCQFEIPH